MQSNIIDRVSNSTNLRSQIDNILCDPTISDRELRSRLTTVMSQVGNPYFTSIDRHFDFPNFDHRSAKRDIDQTCNDIDSRMNEICSQMDAKFANFDNWTANNPDNTSSRSIQYVDPPTDGFKGTYKSKTTMQKTVDGKTTGYTKIATRDANGSRVEEYFPDGTSSVKQSLAQVPSMPQMSRQYRHIM